VKEEVISELGFEIWMESQLRVLKGMRSLALWGQCSLWERANDDLPSLRAKGQKVLLPK
jgi:hypothetical protein